MLEYVVPGNTDDRILRRAADILRKGGLAAFPTDTSWSVGCSIASKDGIARLKRLVGREAEGPLTVICSALQQVSELCELDTVSFRAIKRLVPGPYVFILPSTNRAAKDFDLRRGELGVRIPENPLPCALVDALALPILSVTAKRTLLGMDPSEAEFPEELLFSGGWEIEGIQGIDLVLDPGEEQERRVSTVLDMRGGEVRVLRRGAGDYP
ncbi:MAG TPA: L-threonylcarbamoyladenylate synthase [Magnetospirillaceae bacterium]|nr:L-threonylcarbamoyladenylate synthase [Magnetospirillaceae bacterium]